VIRGVILFLALLAAAGHAALVAGAGLAAGARWSPPIARAAGALRRDIAAQALWLAALVATTATLGSLFLSGVAGFVPCVLCWYQRIAMYPLAPILAIAAWRGDAAVRGYAWPLVGVGLLISGYHSVLERFPWLESGGCDPRAPCTAIWVWELGYISIPLMAASAFALIGALLALAEGHEEAR